jgi:hypothetical protein
MMAASNSGVSPMVWGFLFLAMKWQFSYEALNDYVQVVTAILIKFSCFHISSNFCPKNS